MLHTAPLQPDRRPHDITVDEGGARRLQPGRALAGSRARRGPRALGRRALRAPHRRPPRHSCGRRDDPGRGRSHPPGRPRPRHSARRDRDRPRPLDLPSRPHRQPHAHPAAGRHHERRIRGPAPEGVDPLSNDPGDDGRAHCPRARLHHHARPRDRGGHVRGRGRTQRDQPRRHPGAADVRGHAGHGAYGHVSPARVLVGAPRSRRRADRGRRGRRPPRGAGAGQVRRGLDQVLLGPPLLHEGRRPALVGELHRRGGTRDRRGGAPPRAQGGCPRHGPRRDPVRAQRGRGHHRARRRARRGDDGHHGAPRRFLVPHHLRRRLRRRRPGQGGRAHLGDDGRPREAGLRQGPAQGREDRLRHRCRRLRLDGAAGARADLHGALRDDAAAGHRVRHARGRGAAGSRSRHRHRGSRPLRGHHRGDRRPAEGHRGARTRALRHEGRSDRLRPRFQPGTGSTP